MHNQPLQPLSDLEALRKENERLRNLLFHLANYTRVNVLPGRDDLPLKAIVAEAMRSVKRKD